MAFLLAGSTEPAVSAGRFPAAAALAFPLVLPSLFSACPAGNARYLQGGETGAFRLMLPRILL